MPSFTVGIATYGDRSWQQLAESHAYPSAAHQAPVIRHHGETLHDARNEILRLCQTEYLIYCDADDCLEPSYVSAMGTGTADMRYPSVRYVTETQRLRPPTTLKVWGHRHDCTGDCLPDGNFMVIGTAVRTQLLRDAGGWRDFPWSEDWDCWLRCWLTGGTIEHIPAAIYRATVRPDSRNRAPDRKFKLAAHEAIHRANFPHLYEQAA